MTSRTKLPLEIELIASDSWTSTLQWLQAHAHTDRIIMLKVMYATPDLGRKTVLKYWNPWMRCVFIHEIEMITIYIFFLITHYSGEILILVLVVEWLWVKLREIETTKEKSLKRQNKKWLKVSSFSPRKKKIMIMTATVDIAPNLSTTLQLLTCNTHDHKLSRVWFTGPSH